GGDATRINVGNELGVTLVADRNGTGGRLEYLEQAHQHEQDHEPDGKVPKVDVHFRSRMAGGRGAEAGRFRRNVSPLLRPYKGKGCARTVQKSRHHAAWRLIRRHDAVGSLRRT